MAGVFSLLLAILVLMITTVTAQAHEESELTHQKPTDSGCVQQYEASLESVQTLKKSCLGITYRDCCQVLEADRLFGGSSDSGVYNVTNVCSEGLQPFLSHPHCVTVLEARCDMETRGGGWLVIFRRKANVSPLVNFTRTWVEYEHGFGTLQTEFWYGLKNIHCLTGRNEADMMIELKQNDGTGITWLYKTFKVDGPETKYTLHIGQAETLEGSGSDRLSYYNNRPFSTIDRDNDANSINCAADTRYGNGGGWWWYSCNYAALTRPHTGTSKILWGGGTNYFPHVEMKIRPKGC